ncbi:hypothetical protein [Anaerocolumna jejuensis]|uniref:hypothetical protein n=1 Tax=Anaerocolumna jejuensis TaxID=259063 RepID=UPI003F7B7277
MKTVTAFRTQEGKNEIFKAYDEFLQGWGFLYEEIFIDTRYGKTYILAGGDKKAGTSVILRDRTSKKGFHFYCCILWNIRRNGNGKAIC